MGAFAALKPGSVFQHYSTFPDMQSGINPDKNTKFPPSFIYWCSFLNFNLSEHRTVFHFATEDKWVLSQRRRQHIWLMFIYCLFFDRVYINSDFYLCSQIRRHRYFTDGQTSTQESLDSPRCSFYSRCKQAVCCVIYLRHVAKIGFLV